jgi:hypothetical protein
MKIARAIGWCIGACWIGFVIFTAAMVAGRQFVPHTIDRVISFGGEFVMPYFIFTNLFFITLLYGLVRLLMAGLRVARRQ